MSQEKVYKNIFKFSLIAFVIGSIIFLIGAFWNSHLILGWIVGGFISYLGFFVSFFFLNFIFAKSSLNKWGAFWGGFGRTILHLMIHGIGLIIVLFINFKINNNSTGIKSMQSYLSPINLFTYFASVILLPICSLVTFVFSIWKPKKLQEVIVG